MSCEQIDEQMMDFLYGELSSDARAAFEAHLPGCERCRREVESFGHTRVLARAALDEAPPAHLRARVVAAARAALPTADAARAAPAPAPVRSAAPPARGAGWWDRIRGWWTLPTLATVGALAVFLLGSRLFMNPRYTVVRGKSFVVSGSPAAPARAPAGPADVVVKSAPPADESAQSHTLPEADRRQPGALRVGSGASNRRRSPPATAAAARAARNIADDDLGGLDAGAGRAGAGAGASKPSPAKKGSYRDDPLDGLLSSSKARSAPPAAPSPEPREGFSKDEAPAPVARAPRRPAAAVADLDEAEPPAADKAPRLAERESGALRDEEIPARRRSAPAPTSGKGYPAPAGAPAAAAPAPPPPAPAETSLSASRSEARAKAQVEKKIRANDAKPDAPQAETLVQRADRLFSEGRWVEAVVAYHDLLRQSPSSPDAPRWRRRMAAAEAAIKASPAR